MPREFSPVARLARQMCKALRETPRMGRGQLQERVVHEARLDYARLPTKWRRKLAPRQQDFEAAFALALSSGWIREADGVVTLTEQGQEAARRSRVGRARRRLFA